MIWIIQKFVLQKNLIIELFNLQVESMSITTYRDNRLAWIFNSQIRNRDTMFLLL